jgi:hypothetical protein
MILQEPCLTVLSDFFHSDFLSDLKLIPYDP